jgi:predicted TIM-barrel fold metal-dependent hydrolase
LKPGPTDSPVIDGRLHHQWIDQAELASYLPKAWQAYLGTLQIVPGNPYQNPEGDYVRDEACRQIVATSPSVVADRLQSEGIQRAVLGYDRGTLIAPLANHHLAREACKAANNWTIERWLSNQDDRLFGLVLLSSQVPREAARELRRAGRHPRMVGALLAGNGGGRPFGHPYYEPIFAAAADLDLPVVIEAGGDVTTDSLTQPAGGGWPLTFGEYATLNASSEMTHLVSLISEGVFERFRNLRVLLVGGGVAWLPTLIWRFDMEWKALRREVPWVRVLPSEYIRDHVIIGTQPVNRSPAPEQIQRLLRAYAGMEELLCYTSGFPRWNSDTVSDTARVIPEAWHSKIFFGNANALFRWPTRTASQEGALPLAAASRARSSLI